MPGLLDFGNLNEDQTQGLLAAAAQILQQSGSSRTPASLGQIVGGGMGAYQDSTLAARKRKLDEQQAAQLAEMRGLQMQEARGGLADRDAARAEAQRYQEFSRGGPTPQPAAAPMASALPGGAMSPKVGGPDWMQSYQADNQQTPQPAAQAGPQFGSYEYLMAEAQRAKQAGFPAQAQALIKQAIEVRPKFANEPRIVRGADGKPTLVQMADDGTVRPISGGYGVASKLHFGDGGGAILGMDEYTGQVLSSSKKTATAGDLMADARSRERLNYDRSKEARPTFNAEVGGFISPPSRANPNGAITPLDGFDKRAPKAPTEFQGKSAAFGLRATESHKIISALTAGGTKNSGLIKGAVESVPLIGGALGTAVNALPGILGGPNTDQQKFKQAKRDFINATLRQESGAAIGASEFENADAQYFPQPGDSDEVIAQKSRNRELVIQGFDSNAGRHALTAPAAGTGGVRKYNPKTGKIE